MGIDIGAKEEIYQTIRRLADAGVAVIVVSSDLPELTRLSDRIIVLRKGRIIKEFSEGLVTEEDVLMASTGIVRRGRAMNPRSLQTAPPAGRAPGCS